MKLMQSFKYLSTLQIILRETTRPLAYFAIFCSFILLLSCNKLVDVDAPITSTNATLVYNNDATAIATLNSIYTKLSQQGIGSGITSISLFSGLSADELKVFDDVTDPNFLSFYQNSLTANISGNGDFWTNIYSSYIFQTNAIIEGLTSSRELTPTVKNQLMGEALFLRAFFYFYLVNLYGDVPLVLSTDYKVNSQLSRSKKTDVYNQITNDLKDAQSLLSDTYLDGTLLNKSEERISPNKWVATALLARVYLYNSDWNNAEIESSKIIENISLYDTVPLEEVFLINNKECIWQLQSVSSFVTNTSEAMLFMLPETGPNADPYKVYLSNNIVNSFEQGDKRFKLWTDSVVTNNVTYYFPTKYKIKDPETTPSERSVIFRLSEQYLIRSESRASLGNLSGSLSDINIIRNRAGLPSLSLSSKNEILESILHERQVELFTEWGHRWLDLKRLNLANHVLAPIKGNNWQTTDQLYPIPMNEIIKNTQLQGHQNPGY
ncbi:RagB/SusD family nutrient uptake outer membrane protein [Chitinophaga polysaccharea]|uniref:RagB/SusD family nutrient uptake outer membrane protein n=1 Tax=Chitinophaga polysaccharea TaxID=1293035 RepID=UPI001455A815|nr:RagB/SusD family nutrient uptake outer membrane protein [Chitinophaga polysaccharea]NLR60706.1 RagB/SusD family nutrient uptake outer membrane protein [Chitinophaga polysaccharea]